MSKSVTIRTKLSYRCWNTPALAVQLVPSRARQEGFNVAPSTPVADLEPEALDALAQAWLDDLYEKAGRKRPKLETGIVE